MITRTPHIVRWADDGYTARCARCGQCLGTHIRVRRIRPGVPPDQAFEYDALLLPPGIVMNADGVEMRSTHAGEQARLGFAPGYRRPYVSGAFKIADRGWLLAGTYFGSDPFAVPPGIVPGSYQRWNHAFPILAQCPQCPTLNEITDPPGAPAGIHETSWG